MEDVEEPDDLSANGSGEKDEMSDEECEYGREAPRVVKQKKTEDSPSKVSSITANTEKMSA